MSRGTRVTRGGRFAAAVGAGMAAAVGLMTVQSAGAAGPTATDGVRINHAAAAVPAGHGPGFYRDGVFAMYDNRSPYRVELQVDTWDTVSSHKQCVRGESISRLGYNNVIKFAYYDGHLCR